MKSLRRDFRATILFWAILSVQFPAWVNAGTADAPDKRFFNQLVEGARKEKQIDIYLVTNGSDELATGMTRYLQRLGLNIKFNRDVTGIAAQRTSQAVVETQQGITPTFDVLSAGTNDINRVVAAGGAKRIDHMEALLSEIAPEALPVLDKLSPGPFKGRAFTHGHWIKSILYNPKLISAEELPKTFIELGDPKYKGAFAIAPWFDVANASLLVYDQKKAIEIVTAIGRNKAATEREEAAANRMLLGEFKFVIGNAHYYYKFKSRDPNAPIGLAFTRDYTLANGSTYFVREGAKNPNTAALSVLWTLSKEAQEIVSKAASLPNLYLPTSKMGREIVAMLTATKARVVSWVDDEESLKKLRWSTETEDGKAWESAIAKGWLGR